jgi:hypothetical protein
MPSFENEIGHLGSAYGATSETAWERESPCPYCDGRPLLVVAYREYRNWWVFCPNCERASVANDNYFGRAFAPGRLTLPTPGGVPQTEASLWEEIRSCLSVSANTAVAMLCRKMLLHLAHTHDVANNPSAQPPSNFAAAVDYLKNNHLVPIQFHDWVDQIRQVGNVANHELPLVDAQSASDIALFTHNLLITLYELPQRANIASPMRPAGATASPPSGPPGASPGPTGVNPSGMA